MKNIKKISLAVWILAVPTLICSCGFKLRHTNQLPPQLNSVQIQSDASYDKFTLLLKQNLEQLKKSHSNAEPPSPIVLKIIDADFVHSLPDITTSDKARTYKLTYKVHFSIESKSGHPLLPTQEVMVKRPLTLNPGQTLYSNNEINLLKKEMMKEAVTLLMYRLASQKTRDALP